MGAGFVWFFVPETKRLTLEEMVSFGFFFKMILVLKEVMIANRKGIIGCDLWQ